MNHDEEQELQAYLEALEATDLQEGGAESDREPLELVGLMAYSVDPAPVPADAQSALFRRLGLNDRGLDDRGLDERGLDDRAGDDRPPLAFVDPRRSRPRDRSLLRWALAATVLLTLGFASLSAFLYQRLGDQGERLAELERRFGWYEQTAADVELQTIQTSVRFLSSPEMRACTLEPTSAEQPDAGGTVYMNPQANRWMLAARNLAPAPEGHVYRIWFMTETGPVSGGSFRVEEGRASIELSADELPAGLRAISITIESAASQDEPTGPQVLFGDETHQIL